MAATEVRFSTSPREKRIAPDEDGTPSTFCRLSSGSSLSRRELLATTAVWLLFSTTSAQALIVQGKLPWAPNAGAPPTPLRPGPWVYFTLEEGAAVEALVDRLVPPDPQTPGGKDAGCAVFIDRQLAGPYGSAQGLYMRGPFADGTPEQGLQSPVTPAERYRQSLAALDEYLPRHLRGKILRRAPRRSEGQGDLRPGAGLDKARRRKWPNVLRATAANTQEGFFADPIYGGNRDMAGWKMIGFPGARYDYRDWVERHNETLSAAPCRHYRPAGMGPEANAEPRPEDREYDTQIAGNRCGDCRLRLDRLDPGARADRGGLERGRDRTRPAGATRRPISRRPMPRTSCATACATICSSGRRRTTLTFRNNARPDRAADAHLGAFLLGNGVGGGGVHWNGQTWRFLPDRFRAEAASDPALRRELLPRRHDDPGLGRHLRRARAALRQVRISVRHVRQGRQHQGPDAAGRQPVRGRRARANIRRRRMKQPYGPTLFAKAAEELGYNPFPQPSGNMSQAYTNPLGVSSARAPIAASASGSAAATIPRRARRPRSCRR